MGADGFAIPSLQNGTKATQRANSGLWTCVQVVERLEEAVDTLSRLPMPGPVGYRSSMPDVLREFGDVYGIAIAEGGYRDMEIKPDPPDMDAIDRTIEVLHWLRQVSRRDARLLWARASRRNYWWKLAGRFRMGESTLRRKHLRALQNIVDWLNSADMKKSA